MLSLKPNLEIPVRECPVCRVPLTANGWRITGMRNLAELKCSQCESEFYGDLPVGQALYTPILLNRKTRQVDDDFGVEWFSAPLVNSYANRTSEPLQIEIRKLLPLQNKAILLNCLDVLYGHSLLKLLNAQFYLDRRPDLSLILILPRFLEWLIPDGAAEVWIVDLPLRRGAEWNDWLADEIGERVKNIPEVYLSVAFSHPHSEDFAVERFTQTAPFPLENFQNRQNPVVTFIWREDRLWETAGNSGDGILRKIKRRIEQSDSPLDRQKRKVVEFAESLRGEFPALDFAVAGLGAAGDLPDWIDDLRLSKLDAQAERNWCGRYARSHIVVGVHGSNMLLPSAHAGAVVELIGEDRWGNYLQDILFRLSDAREMFFRYRFVPHSMTPENLARLAATILRFEDFRRLMSPEFCRHRKNQDFEQWISRGGKKID